MFNSFNVILFEGKHEKICKGYAGYCTVPASSPSLGVYLPNSESAGWSSSLSVSELTLSSMSNSIGSLPKALDLKVGSGRNEHMQNMFDGFNLW